MKKVYGLRDGPGNLQKRASEASFSPCKQCNLKKNDYPSFRGGASVY